jgi:hypothetical protein
MSRLVVIIGALAVGSLLVLPGAPAQSGRSGLPLTVSINGKGTVTVAGRRLSCSSSCTKKLTVRAGARLVLLAQPGRGWKLSAWSGACRGSTSACRVRVIHALRVAVTFLAPGARANPIALGAVGDAGEGWRLKVVSATPDATQQVLATTNGYGEHLNPTPPAGAQDFLVLLSLTYAGGGSGDLSPFFFRLAAMGAHNARYSRTENGCGNFLPPPVVEEQGSGVFSGQTVTGNVCFQVASNDAGSLLLYVSLSLDGGKRWFALR